MLESSWEDMQEIFPIISIKHSSIRPSMCRNFIRNPSKDSKLTGSNITFLERETYRLIHPQINALVVTLTVTNIT